MTGVRRLNLLATVENMRFIHLVVSLLCGVAVGCTSTSVRAPNRTLSPSDEVLARAFEQGRSNVQVEGRGVGNRRVPQRRRLTTACTRSPATLPLIHVE